MMRKNLLTIVLGMVVVLGVVGSTNAAIITGESIESFTVPVEVEAKPYENMINDSGLFESGGSLAHTATSGAPDAWYSLVPYNGSTPFPFTVTIDLEGNYDLSSMDVWNYNSDGQYNRGVQGVTISVASAEGGAFTSLGNFTFDQANAHYDGKFRAQNISLSASNVRLVQFEITSNHGDIYRTGMAEVQFDGIEIPEPASFLLLMLGGFGLMFRRPRRR